MRLSIVLTPAIIGPSLDVDLFSTEFKGKPIGLRFVPIAVSNSGVKPRHEGSVRECSKYKMFSEYKIGLIQSRAAG